MPDSLNAGDSASMRAENERLRAQLRHEEAQRESERAAAATEHERLTYELGHRVKNTLSVVQALASQTLRGSVPREEALEAFGGRIQALARANDVILQQSWTTASIRSVADSILQPMSLGPDRLEIDGPDLAINASAALSLAMALNELASNAKRFGAWSQPNGRVRLDWSVDASDPLHGFALTWAEIGGPAAADPAKRGFGLKLIEQSLRSALGRDIAFDFAPTGLICRVRTTLPKLQS